MSPRNHWRPTILWTGHQQQADHWYQHHRSPSISHQQNNLGFNHPVTWLRFHIPTLCHPLPRQQHVTRRALWHILMEWNQCPQPVKGPHIYLWRNTHPRQQLPTPHSLPNHQICHVLHSWIGTIRPVHHRQAYGSSPPNPHQNGLPQPTIIPTNGQLDRHWGQKNSIVPKLTKSMYMRFHWIQFQDSHNLFRYYWAPGTSNLDDYITKHHPPLQHEAHLPTHVVWKTWSPQNFTPGLLFNFYFTKETTLVSELLKWMQGCVDPRIYTR